MKPILKISVVCLTLGFIATAALPAVARDFSISGRRGTTLGNRTFTRNAAGGFQRTGQWSGTGNKGGSRILNSKLNADGKGVYQQTVTRTATGSDGKTLNTTAHHVGTYSADAGVSNSGTKTIAGPKGGSINSNTTVSTDGQGNFQRSVTGTGTTSDGKAVNISGSSSGSYNKETGISSSGTHTLNGNTVNSTFNDGILNITEVNGCAPNPGGGGSHPPMAPQLRCVPNAGGGGSQPPSAPQ